MPRHIHPPRHSSIFFFFNDTATTEIYTLSLHDALPISRSADESKAAIGAAVDAGVDAIVTIFGPSTQAARGRRGRGDRKSTRLNSSHPSISYAVFCLKKKKKQEHTKQSRTDTNR